MQESGDLVVCLKLTRDKREFEQTNPDMNYPGPLPSVKTIAKF